MWHTVSAGDSLSKLAAQFLGDMMAYMQIFNENKDQLTDPNSVRIGQTLWIPVGGKPNPKNVPISSGFSTTAVTPEIVETTATRGTQPNERTVSSTDGRGEGFLRITDPAKFNRMMMLSGGVLAVLAFFLFMRKK